MMYKFCYCVFVAACLQLNAIKGASNHSQLCESVTMKYFPLHPQNCQIPERQGAEINLEMHKWAKGGNNSLQSFMLPIYNFVFR